VPYKKPGSQDTSAAGIFGVPGRIWLYVFTGAATVFGIQLLYLANDDLKLNIGLTSAVVVGFAFSYFISAAYHRFIVVLLDIAAISIFISSILKVKANSTAWGTEFGVLLGVLIALYSFRAFSDRDHRVILAACLVIMLLASVASYDVKLMFILPLFIFCAFASLYIANNISLSEKIPYMASELGAARSIVYLAGRTTAAALFASVLIYMVVPHGKGIHNPRFRMPKASFISEEDMESLEEPEIEQLKQNSYSGFSDEFNLSRGGDIELKNDPVLLVRGTLNDYLRGKVFDIYTGTGWEQDKDDWMKKHAPEHKSAAMGGPTRDDRYASVAGDVTLIPLVDFPSPKLEQRFRRNNQDIFVTRNNIFSSGHNDELKYSTQHLEISFLKNDLPIFFSPYQPYRVEDVSRKTGPSGDQDDFVAFAEPVSDAYSIIKPASDAQKRSYFPKGLQYKLFVLRPSFIPAKLKDSFDKPPVELRKHYTQLPKLVTENAQLVDLAKKVARGKNPDAAVTMYDKVRNIYEFFVSSGEFEYSLQYPELPTRDVFVPGTAQTQQIAEMDAAAHFVFVTKKGYCEYFANAFAVFCRINGIPARIVTGYAPGTYNFLQNGFVVASRNAHSWAEVYFDGFGWVTFDPTPASSDFLSASEIQSFLSSAFDFIQKLFVIDPTGVQQAIAAFFILLGQRLYEVAIDNEVTSFSILALLIGFLIWSWWRRLPKRLTPPVPKNAVVSAYYAVERALAADGWIRPESTTTGAFLNQMAERLAGLGPSLKEFAELYYYFAYSGKEPSAEDSQRAEAIAREVGAFLEAQRKRRNARGQAIDN